jgi:hypothetical protein
MNVNVNVAFIMELQSVRAEIPGDALFVKKRETVTQNMEKARPV